MSFSRTSTHDNYCSINCRYKGKITGLIDQLSLFNKNFAGEDEQREEKLRLLASRLILELSKYKMFLE